MQKARYTAGLNDFEYCGSLCISGPNFDPTEATDQLNMQPHSTTVAGSPHPKDPRRISKLSTWSIKLTAHDGEDLPTFLYRVVDLLAPAKAYLTQLSQNKTRIECFVGIFPTQLCDQCYFCELLLQLAELHVDLRLDMYSAEHVAAK